MTLLVNDFDETKAFYAAAFGFETLFDAEIAPGLRTVHIGPGGMQDAGLWLIAARDDASRERIGTQTGGEPALVLYTDDITADLQRLETLGVVPKSGPDSDEMGATYAHILDNSGNELVLVQLPPAEPASQRPEREFTIGYIEFATDDPARSASFYEDLFGWEVARGDYTAFHTGNLRGGFPDTVNGFAPVRAVLEPGDTLVYVDVNDLDATLAKARDLGATILLDKIEPGPGHLLAIIADPAGTRIALGQSDWT